MLWHLKWANLVLEAIANVIEGILFIKKFTFVKLYFLLLWYAFALTLLGVTVKLMVIVLWGTHVSRFFQKTSYQMSKTKWGLCTPLWTTFFFSQNEATFPLVRKDYYIESIRRLIHISGRLPPIKSKKMSPLTLPCGLT